MWVAVCAVIVQIITVERLDIVLGIACGVATVFGLWLVASLPFLRASWEASEGGTLDG